MSHEVVSVFNIILTKDAKWGEMFRCEALSSFLLMSLKI